MKRYITVILTGMVASPVFAVTNFVMNFDTVQPGGSYRPKNVVAAWVTKSDGTFVKTILRYAGERKSSLSTWYAAAGSSDADAVMGATRPNHTTPTPMTAPWDLKDKSGNVVPDGNYLVKLECADGSRQAYSFTFVKDSTAGTRTDSGNTYFKNISITYTPPTQANTAPVANSQSVTNAEDVSKAITLTATDAEGDPLTYSIASSPSHGTLSAITATNQITYTPAANYYGADSFTFNARDASSTSTPATVSITVTPVNDAPVAQAQSVTNAEDTAKLITLAATDAESNALTYAVVSNPLHGTLSAITATNQITYTPATNYYGADSFTFTARDASLTSTPATVSITVTPVNDAPAAQAQSVTNTEDTAKAITLTATDAETNTLTYGIVAGPLHGSLSGAAPNITYTPATNYFGADSFTFKANDGLTDSATAAVSITVTPVNDPPVAQNQSPTAVDGNALSITLIATDAETNALSYYLVSQPLSGYLSGTPPELNYLPKKGVSGADSFAFKASDGAATGNTATVSITLVFTDGDGDGIPDSWENAHNMTNGVNDATVDSDGDKASNYEEYMAGTDPFNTNSVFAVYAPQRSGGSNVLIRWSSVQDHLYTVQSATNLTGGWNTLISNSVATPPLNVYTAPANQAASSFFRVLLDP